MRKNKKFIAALLTLSMFILACVGGMSVFAESDNTSSTESADDGTTAAVVSGCDLKSDNLVKAKVKQYGLSMLVPKGDLLTIDSDPSEFSSSDYSRTYFMEQGCILYSYTNNDNYCAVTVFVSDQDSIYDYYGDYSNLSAAKRDELVAESSGDGYNAEFVTINGRNYIQVTTNDNSTGDNYTQYQFTTVIGDKQYVIYIQTLNADSSDKEVLNEMIGSIKLSGEGMKLSSADIILTIVCIILLIAVIVIYFFFYRANQFVKLGITNYPRLGFDLPKTNKLNDEDILDEDDEAYEDEDVDEDDDSDEADDDGDDERIIKD